MKYIFNKIADMQYNFARIRKIWLEITCDDSFLSHV